MDSSDLNGQFAELVQVLEQLENTVDQLTATLPQDNRELFLRLMVALDMRDNNPLLPIFVALQFYSEYLKSLSIQLRSVATTLLEKIPREVKSAGDAALTKALTSYGSIQTQIDQSVTSIEFSRTQWNRDTETLLPKLEAAFATAKTDAVEAYQAEIRKQAEASLQDWRLELEDTRKLYLSDVLKQGLIWASGAIAIALLAVGGAAYWVGTQQGRDGAVQNSYKAFGSQANYEFAKKLMNRSDNVQRFVKCQKEENEKCTVWMRNPP
jgi:hypothetical protein